MRICLILFFFLVFGCAQQVTKNQKERAQYHFQIGTSNLSRGKLPQALGELMEAEKLDPENQMIQNNLGVAYFARAKHDLALIHFQKALKINSAYTDARNNLASLYIETGKYKEALGELETCRKDLTYPNPEKIYMNIGLTYFKLKNYSEAIISLKKTLELKRDHCQAMNLYGRAQYELKQYRVAAESLDQAVHYCQNINFDEPYYFSGLSFLRLGNNERASARFNEVIKLYPNGTFAGLARNLLEGIK